MFLEQVARTSPRCEHALSARCSGRLGCSGPGPSSPTTPRHSVLSQSTTTTLKGRRDTYEAARIATQLSDSYRRSTYGTAATASLCASKSSVLVSTSSAACSTTTLLHRGPSNDQLPASSSCGHTTTHSWLVALGSLSYCSSASRSSPLAMSRGRTRRMLTPPALR